MVLAVAVRCVVLAVVVRVVPGAEGLAVFLRQLMGLGVVLERQQGHGPHRPFFLIATGPFAGRVHQIPPIFSNFLVALGVA